jgi:hypothetical protein
VGERCDTTPLGDRGARVGEGTGQSPVGEIRARVGVVGEQVTGSVPWEEARDEVREEAAVVA